MSLTERGLETEAQQIWERRAIRTILREPDFAFYSDGNNIPFRALSEEKFKQFYPNFNIAGLTPDDLGERYYVAGGLEKLVEKAQKMHDSGQSQEAKELFTKIALIKNPQESMKSDLREVCEATNGSLSMCINLLGLKEVEGARQWVDFIIRSWGEVPAYK